MNQEIGKVLGTQDAEPLGYIPLPPAVVEKIKAAVETIQAKPGV